MNSSLGRFEASEGVRGRDCFDPWSHMYICNSFFYLVSFCYNGVPVLIFSTQQVNSSLALLSKRCRSFRAHNHPAALNRGRGESLMPPDTRGIVSLTGGGAKAWRLLTLAEASFSRGARRKPGASVDSQKRLSLSLSLSSRRLRNNRI